MEKWVLPQEAKLKIREKINKVCDHDIGNSICINASAPFIERVAEQVRDDIDSLVCKQMIAVHVDPNVVNTLTKEILRLESENKKLIEQQIQPFTVDEVKAIIAENDYLRERLNEMEE